MLRRRELRLRVDANGCRFPWLEPHVDVEHLHQAPDQKSGANEQHAGKRNLGNDKCVPHPAAAATLG